MSRESELGPERRALRFLASGPLTRWKGRWRFGLAWISDEVVDRLLDAGKACRNPAGDRVHAAPAVVAARPRARQIGARR